MTETIIIVGAGHAAGQAAASLRQKGFSGRLIMIGDEPYVPYQRPPLSKAFLAGELELERLFFKPENFWPKHDVETMLSTRVKEIDRKRKTITLDNSEIIAYNKLILATGSRVRELHIPGHTLKGVHYLRGIDDVLAIQSAFKKGARLVIVGGGYIGLEVAAVGRKNGLDVTVMETESRVMNRVVATEISQFFQNMHAEEGVKLELGRRVQELQGDKNGQLTEVACMDGFTVPADICIIGIGIIPNIELAEAADILCSDGIIVDEHCRTLDEDIYAIGDCTRHPNPILGRHLRLESVHNAIEQGKTAAAAICGTPVAYAQVPWFWSDQYNVKLQITGLTEGYDQFVMRGDPASRSFAAFYLQDGKLLAVDAINSPREFMLGKKLITAGAKFTPEILADMEQDFKTLATAALEVAKST
ncbi:MAG: FAD-dependent oxidoreductase [Gammaproteobacteria bacterium]|nr:FAD-dependent oxidoreductase [Gammaproteobacteria bacterium]MCP4091641.1 FAD-dependent oxidoreductase [Gammaproteobacteria bacterium]MCP4276137.1 FAD-dependent oxidoreductase [Gammaproteobacteria bacterium]MCP4929707.1 FAD-dependent oxidoreductase [Gammaproteobacteria bacterium]